MVGYGILTAQATEPAVRQIEVNRFAHPALRPNAEAVTDDEHAHHQLRIDRQPPGAAVERRHLPAQLAQVEEAINAA